jgi:hypothetical protein
MSILEDKIRKNREHYDVHEPGQGHLERFTSRLDAEFHAAERKPLRIAWRKAAAFILLAAVTGLLIYQFAQNTATVNASPMDDELSQVAEYYNRLSEQRINSIRGCAATDEEAAKVSLMAESQLEKLEKEAVVLKEELNENSSDDRVYGALVNNYRTRIKILDNIITQLCQL